MRLTADDYRAQLQALLPAGLVWPRAADATWTRLLAALADGLARLHDAAETLVEDADPRTTNALLADWEALCDLVPPLEATAEARRIAVLQVVAARGGQSRLYFATLAAVLGHTITITEFRPFRAGVSAAGDPAFGEAFAHAWLVQTSEAEVTVFTAGSRAGEPLQQVNVQDLEGLFTRLKPAHTHVLFGVL